MTDTLLTRFGALSFPIPPGSATDTLAALDPAKGRLLALFQTAINAELGEVWGAVTSTLPSNHPLFGTTPVQKTLQLEPTRKLMQEIVVSYPLLCLHRSGEATDDEFTFVLRRSTQPWTLHYILGELKAADIHKLGDITFAASRVVERVIEQRGHPAYDNGALQFFPGTGSLSSLRKVSHECGQATYARDSEGPLFYAMVITLESTEISGDSEENYGPLEGADYGIGVGSQDEGFVPELVLGDTDHTPE